MQLLFKNTDKIGRIVTITSFIIGTIFLLSYMILRDLDIAILGFYYLIAATIINLIISLIFLVLAFYNINKKRKYLKTIFVMLINIPIATAYFFIVTTIL
jgi:hypothetical protein